MNIYIYIYIYVYTFVRCMSICRSNVFSFFSSLFFLIKIIQRAKDSIENHFFLFFSLIKIDFFLLVCVCSSLYLINQQSRQTTCIFNSNMMLPDSPQNIVVVRAPSPSIHYLPTGINGENLVLPTATTQQPTIQTTNQPVSESWCLTSVKVIKVG